MTAQATNNKAPRTFGSQITWWFLLVLCSAALYLPTRSFPGTQDVATITGWIDEALRVGLAEGLTVPRDYPPGSTSIHWVLVVTGAVSLESVVKVTNFATLVLFAAYSARNDALRGVQVLGVFALSSAFLGYTDILFAPFALMLTEKRVSLWAAMCGFAAMVLLKWTALIAAPLLFVRVVSAIRSSGFRSVIQQLIPAAVMLTVVAWFFSPFVLLDKFQYAMKTTVSPSANALNPHWVVSKFAFDGAPYGSPVYDDLWPIYEISFSFATLVLSCSFALLWFLAGAPHDYWLVALRGSFSAYFLVAYSVHENHLFLAVFFTLIGYWRGIFPGWQLGTIVAFFNLNLLLFYGFTGDQRLITGYEWAGSVSAITGSVVLIVMITDDLRRLLSRNNTQVVGRFVGR